LEAEEPKFSASPLWHNWELRLFHTVAVTCEFNLTGWRLWKSVAGVSESLTHLVAAGGLVGELVEAELGEDAIVLNQNIATKVFEEIESICKANQWSEDSGALKELEEFINHTRACSYCNVGIVYW
jgi:hypothetical protein